MQHPWVGVVNRSQAEINKNVDMINARRKEQEYFEHSPEYSHLAHKMGSEYLAKLLSKVSILKMFGKCFVQHYCNFTDLTLRLLRISLTQNCYSVLNQHLEVVIRQKIPSIIALINKTIDEINAELDRIGRPIAADGGVIINFHLK